MSEMLSGALSRVLYLGWRLESDAKGTRYLASPQKRMLDAHGARILRPVAAPLIDAARLAVWAESGGPTLVSLPRVGKGGVLFSQHKVRSMVTGSEQIVGAPLQPKIRDDRRITRVGGFIRKLSIDELPQLENVFAGEMSLVGPRPKTPQEFAVYCDADSSFEPAYILQAPGLTGLEQINGRGASTPAQRIEATLEYATEASLSLDIKILRETINALRSKDGAY